MQAEGRFLGLTRQEAEASWARILQRRQPAPGGRQEDYLPAETLLCYGLFLVMNPHHYGGRNMAQAPPPLHQMAHLFRRPPRSILEKMFNLDGSRPNRAAGEWQLFVRLQEEASLYAHLYATVMTAARVVGIGTDRLEDFLGLEGGGRLVILGQEELPESEIEHAVQDGLPGEQHRLAATIEETERLLIGRVRIGQHLFARSVLARCEGACVFCGMAPRSLPGEGLLMASHVKPWRDSAPRERLDPSNGLAACPTHDATFDAGLITIEDDLTVTLSSRLEASIAADPCMGEHFGSQALRPRLLLSTTSRPGRDYLQWHRVHVYQTVA